eukprot:Opistho-2@78076
MSYFADSDRVLSNVSLTIQAGEKVGIVGRTGSGKSSLLMVLFRLVEPATGTIFIDDVDICKMDLEDLRSSMSIIPQEPVMFKGTIRSNLDPFGAHPDERLWRALELSHLKATVEEFPMKLEAPVLEQGRNLSLGQKQLFCLTRAILNDSKILVLDEATSALDLETDALIQETIRTVFEARTVLTIAHRLETIMDYDKVLFMDRGLNVEFGKHADLLANPEGHFSRLVRG